MESRRSWSEDDNVCPTIEFPSVPCSVILLQKHDTSRARLRAILKYILIEGGIRVLLQIATTQPEKNVQEVREYDLSLDVVYTGLKYRGKVTAPLDSIAAPPLNPTAHHTTNST